MSVTSGPTAGLADRLAEEARGHRDSGFGAMKMKVGLSVAEDNLPARRVFASAGFRPAPGRPGSYPAGQRSLTLRKRIPRPGLDSLLFVG